MNRIHWPLRRAKLILKTEGVIPLIRRGIPFLVRFVLVRFVRYRTCYLYEYATENVCKLNEADFMPKVNSFTLKIVSTNDEADELEKGGLEFRSHTVNARERLDNGVVAFCVFILNELASINWVAMTPEAKVSLLNPPYCVDFSKGEVCHSGVWTHPRYRRMGLASYVHYKVFQFLNNSGKLIDRCVIGVANTMAQSQYAKLRPNLYAEGHYLKILWWKWWKEKQLP